MRRAVVTALLGAMTLLVVAAVWVGVTRNGFDLLGPDCVASVDGHRVELDREQAEHAALITAIAVRRQMPARAASIALATAYQESGLYNVEHGDRDSLGLFQQRPSQGWGTEEQVMDPVHATNAFYDALDGIAEYEQMEITDAAQAVQRSGFPRAYATHEDNARALASALTGNSPAAFTCEISDRVETAAAELNDRGLTERADAVRREALGVFGDLDLGGFAPGGVQVGHMEGSAHYDGRAIDVMLRPVNAENRKLGWAVAHYFVAQAERLRVQTVIFDGRIWTARRSKQGWRDYDPPNRTGDRAILEHRDHVHIDVFE